MKRMILIFALALAPCFAVAADAAPAAARQDDADAAKFRTKWLISLDVAGKVTAIEPADATLVDAARIPLERAIREWRFVPGHVDGAPAPTETILTLDIALVPAGDDHFNVRIDDARTGGDIAIKGARKPPKYPPDAIQHRWQGMVVLKVDYDADGRVVTAKPAEGAPTVAQSLVRSAEKAVRDWGFSPEVVGGHALAGSALISVCFDIVPAGTRPKGDCVWTPPGARSALRETDAFALEPATRLETDVVGHML
jgi:TonB family protein